LLSPARRSFRISAAWIAAVAGLPSTKGIPRKVNKLAITALRLAAASKSQTVNETILLDATAEAML
jgi:hypothetical protein